MPRRRSRRSSPTVGPWARPSRRTRMKALPQGRRRGRRRTDVTPTPTRSRQPTEGQRRQHPLQHLEHRTVMSFLPLNSVPSCAFIPRADSYGALAKTFSARVARGPHGDAPPRAPLLPLSFCKSCIKRQLFTQAKGRPVLPSRPKLFLLGHPTY
jgi:hypothetical protein